MSEISIIVQEAEAISELDEDIKCHAYNRRISEDIERLSVEDRFFFSFADTVRDS